LQKEFGRGNIDLSIRLLGILTTHEFDMGNIGLTVLIVKDVKNKGKGMKPWARMEKNISEDEIDDVEKDIETELECLRKG